VTEEEYKSLYAEKNDDPTKPKMIFVEGGAFRLSTNWQNYHKVTVSSFEIGETEVTFGLYYPSIGKEIDESRKDYAAANVNWYEAVIFCNRLSMKYGYEPCYTLNGETDPSLWGDEIPYFTESDGNVGDMAAWNAIQCNFNANGYRLPTDAEWCYAAQGGKKRKNTKYSGSDILDEVGWYEDNAKKDGQQVALKMPNELGIYDMSGNLWEWCWNKGGVYSKKTEVNPISLFDENNQRVIRGGGDGSPESSCEVTYTNSDEPNVKSWYYGFRLCRSIRKR
ncbi:MAG: SUMF1/EgtB/PvdO family nonheme iron enzyme, partial [Treponema sp.]|nr:SUMF1/EgtB/PvdO family nonheme iron enzyme [Treponema sp.]